MRISQRELKAIVYCFSYYLVHKLENLTKRIESFRAFSVLGSLLKSRISQRELKEPNRPKLQKFTYNMNLTKRIES